MHFRVSAKTKRDGRTGGGGGALQYLRPRAYGAAGDKNNLQFLIYGPPM